MLIPATTGSITVGTVLADMTQCQTGFARRCHKGSTSCAGCTREHAYHHGCALTVAQFRLRISTQCGGCASHAPAVTILSRSTTAWGSLVDGMITCDSVYA
ncbi:hypothetical protein COO60DRAFT_891606 [Scenedesmus sp. NREL 46B-D3]|nr:hypothetical protein COO60DRAFT_891606 [Scenedesmus sp. NREL 46B-D3]